MDSKTLEKQTLFRKSIDMARLFYLLFLLSTNSYYSCSQDTSIQWEFKINYPDSLDIYINDTHIVNSSEFGVFYDEKFTYSFDVLFALSSYSDTIHLKCSKFVDCEKYEFSIDKEILMSQKNILNSEFSLKVKSPEYTKEIIVNPQDGNFILIMNNIEVNWWFQQNDEPFTYGSSQPNRIE